MERVAWLVHRAAGGSEQGARVRAEDERLDLLRRSLSLLATHVDQPALLQQVAEGILAEAPDDADAELALVKLFTETERWPALVALQQARARRMADPLLRGECLLRIARLQEEKLGDAKAAVQSLQEAVAVEPENLRALHELARLLEAQGDRQSLVSVLAREAALSEEGTAWSACCAWEGFSSATWAGTGRHRGLSAGLGDRQDRGWGGRGPGAYAGGAGHPQ